MDIYLGPTKVNIRRAIRAIATFFGGSVPSYVNEQTLLDPSTIVQLGVALVRVDFLSTLATTSFKVAWKNRVDAPYGRVSAHYLGIDDLIAEKTHFARLQDLADIEQLKRARAKALLKGSKT